MKNILPLVIALTFVPAAMAQMEQGTIERGFQPGKLYQFGDLDAVNVFNGNLVVRLPIGPTYPLNGNLSYGLTLSYNSKIWDLSDGQNGVRAKPSARSNAGSGWLLGMGRFIPYDDPTVTNNEDIYEAPDGGDHRFEDGRASDTATGCVTTRVETAADRCPAYTFDGTSLRLRYLVNVREIDFPDGTTRHFEKDSAGAWYLKSIKNALGNESVTISHALPASVPQCDAPTALWTITAPRQTTYVCFKNYAVDGSNRPMVDRIILTSVYGSPSTYQFAYIEQTQISRPAEDTEDDAAAALFLDQYGFHHLPTLASVTLPDQSRFAFTYTGPLVASMQLPTRGSIAYTYGSYVIPPLTPCAGEWSPHAEEGGSKPHKVANGYGVVQRDFRAALPAGHPADQPAVQTWRYEGTKEMRGGSPNQGYTLLYNCASQTYPAYPVVYDEFVVRVTDPFNIRTDSHFSVWADNAPSPNGAVLDNYGLPYGVYDAVQDRYLSQEIFDCNITPCRLMRSIYVRHDKYGVLPYGSRLASQQVVYHPLAAETCPDGECKSIIDYTDWDDISHYRTVTTTSNFGRGGDPRKVTTSWNKRGVDAFVPARDKTWVTNIYEDVKTTAFVPKRMPDGTTDGTAEVSDTAVEQACFSPDTGFLMAKRSLAEDTPKGRDLLGVFSADGEGNLVTEAYYGGYDAQISANDANLCTALTHLTDTPRYQITHVWSSGVMISSQYVGASFKSLDLKADASTGAILTSKDASLLETSYSYEPGTGRLLTVHPPGRGTTGYRYFKAGSHFDGTDEILDSPAFVEELTTSSGTAGVLRHEYHYDSFGRLWREKSVTHENTWSLRETVWDALNRKKSVSELVTLPVEVPSTVTVPSATELRFSPASKTTYVYDYAGRPLTVTAPDSSVTTAAYGADGSVVRTVSVATGAGPQSAVTTELRDGAGRLASVQESSDTNDGNITTQYRYDVGGRLTHAATTWNSVSQTRDFIYDHRGLLTKEIQPENGATSYPEYDARGHLLSKQVGSGGTHFDLTYNYDFAERLVHADSSDGKLKLFEYASDDETVGQQVSHVKGKLKSATRWTYDPVGGTFSVKENYSYFDASGSLTDKSTSIDRLDPASPQTVLVHYQTIAQSYHYDDLGERDTVTYPTCAAPLCGAPGFASISPKYKNGAIDTVPLFADSISYAPNGIVTSLQHSNGVTDSEEPDSSGMPRAHSITVSGWSQPVCSPVVITQTGGTNPINSSSAGSASTAAVSGATYAWTISGGTFTSATNGTGVTFTAGCSGNVTLGVTVTAACGTASTSLQIPIAGPTATLSGGGTIDAGGSVQLQVVLVGAAPFQLTWSDGFPQRDQSGTATRSVSPFLSTTYSVTATDANGCAAVVSGNAAAVTVLQTASFSTLCAGRTCTFTASGAVNGQSITSWSWAFGDGANGTGQTVSHTYGGSGATYLVALTMTDGSGHSTLVSKQIVICAPAVLTSAPVSASSASGDVTAQFAVSGTISEVHWYVLNGNVSTEITSTDSAQRLSVSGNQVRLHSATLDSATVFARIFSCGGATSGGIEIDTVAVTLSIVSCAPKILGVSAGGAMLQATVGIPLSVFVDPPESDTVHYTYQWYRASDGAAMNGAIAATFLASTQTFDSFYCVVGNVCGGTTSQVTSPKSYIWLYGVCDLPALQTSQTAYDLLQNSLLGTTFTAFVDWPDVTYQWYQGQTGDTRQPLSGNEGAPNKLTAGRFNFLAQAYWVRATVPCGAYRDSATLGFSKFGCTPIVFAPQPQSALIDYGASTVLTVDAPTTIPVPTYSWYRLGDTAPFANGSAVRVTPTVSTRYSVVANNGCSAPATSAVATVRVGSCSSIGVIHWPHDQWTAPGTAVDLTVDGVTSQVSYQWYAGEVGDESNLIPTATLATYHTPVISAPSSFWVRLRNGSCVADSPTIHVNICDPLHVISSGGFEHNIYPGSGPAFLVYPVTGTSVTYQWYLGQPLDVTLPFERSVNEIVVNPSVTTTYWVRVTGHCGDNVSTLDSPAFHVSVCPRFVQQPAAATDTVMPGVTTTLTAAATNFAVYQWFVGNTGDLSHPFGGNTATVTTPPITADTTFWVRLSSGSCQISSENVTVHVCAPLGVSWGFAPHPLHVGDLFTLAIAYAPDGYQLYWYRGVSGDVEHSTLISGGPISSSLYFQLPPASVTASYWVRLQVGTCYGDSSTLTLPVCMPTITQPPQDPPMINVGDSATLSVAAIPAGVTYQWYVGESGDTTTPIPNATGSTYTVQPTVDTRYWVAVSGCGTANSTSARVAVCQVPHITLGPAGTSIPHGATASLAVSATGTNLTYQWYSGTAPDTSTPIYNLTSQSAVMTIATSVTTSYWVRVSGSCGTPQNSATALVSVCPLILQQPLAALDPVMPGATTTLTASGSDSPVYQWYQGDTRDISHPFGGNTPTVTTPAITADTKFWVMLSSGTCSVYSDSVTVHLCALTEVHWAAFPHPLRAGESFTMQIMAQPDGAQLYWYRGASGDLTHSTLLAGPINSSYYYQVVPDTPTATYWVRVKVGDCYADSSTFTLTVCVPTIIQQPVGAAINSGGSATLSVAATPAALTYQWYTGVSGDDSHPIANATSSSYTASPAADTSFWVRVTGSCGATANSDAVLVTVCFPPAIVSNASLTQWYMLGSGSTPTVWVSATGNDLTYQWYTGASGNTTNPYMGAGSATNAINVTPSNTTSYWARVSGSCGTPVNSTAMVVNVCASPVITAQPQGSVIVSGGTATMSVVVTEATTTPVIYQWYRGASGDTSALVGTNSASFTTPALTTQTSYWVRVSCGLTCAPTDSQVATVSMCPNPQILPAPADQYIAIGHSATLTTGYGGSSYQWFSGTSGDVSHPASSPSTLPSFVVSPSVTTQYWAQIQSGTCVSRTGSATVNVCIPTITTDLPANLTINTGTSTTLTVVANTPSLTYQWYRGATGDTSAPVGTNSASFTTPALTTQTSYWVRVTGSCNQKADSSTATIAICYPPAIVSTATASQSMILGSTTSVWASATGNNLTYQWYVGSSGNTTTPYMGAGGGTNVVNVTPSNTTSYWVRVSGSCGASVDSNAMVVNVCASPSITAQPQGSMIFSGSTATMSVAATEATTTPLTYQWYRGASGDTSAPVGTNSASFTTPALTTVTNYWVRVSCGVCGPADSQTAAVSMCYNTQVLAAPADQLIAVGQAATLTAPCCGNTYQWFAGASGVTTQPVSSPSGVATFTTSPSATTQYWAQVVNNGCVSRTLSATVNICIPTFTQSPASITIAAGSSTTLTASANTVGVTYQWYNGTSGSTGSPISGATGSSVTVTPGSTSNYWVRATGSCGRVTDSSTATVTICSPPVITQQPNDSSPVYGGSGTAYFVVYTTGSNLTYQWYFGNSGDTSAAIDGATSSTFSLWVNSTQKVWVRVTGQCGAVNSRSVFANVMPQIWTQPPSNINVGYGSTAFVSMYATGNYLSYTWRYGNGTLFAITSTPSVVTPSLTANNTIHCEVWSGTAVAYTYETALTICYNGPPASIAKFQNGSCTMLYVTAYGADSYEWYQGARGDTSHLLSSGGYATSVNVCPTTSTQYWLRAITLNPDSSVSCYTDSGVIIAP